MAYNYDKQIVRLTKKPDLIEQEWFRGEGLFRIMGKSEDIDYHTPGPTCGCLTQIRCLRTKAAFVNGSVDKDLTQAIRRDKRLPKDVHKIEPKHFPVFKEYQQLMDSLTPGRK